MVDLTVKPTREEISRAFNNDFRLTKAFEGLFDSLGTTGTSSQFLPTPDLNDEENVDYFYFGWEEVNNGWLVRRQSRVDSTFEDATFTTNNSYATLSEAWLFRTNLNYG